MEKTLNVLTPGVLAGNAEMVLVPAEHFSVHVVSSAISTLMS